MKKLLCIVLLSFCILSLQACRQKYTSDGVDNTITHEILTKEDSWGLELSTSDVTQTSLTLTLTQKGEEKYDLTTTLAFYIETLIENEWTYLPFAGGEQVIHWPIATTVIPPDESVNFNVNWENLYGSLSPGTYRISKEIVNGKIGENAKVKTFYAQFIIE